MCKGNGIINKRRVLLPTPKSDPIDKLILASHFNMNRFLVATPHPTRPLFKKMYIDDVEGASSFANLRFTANGSSIIMHIHHKDGRSASFPMDSESFDEVHIQWNDTVSIQLEGFEKKTIVQHFGSWHVITID
ncbi:hypothetical protein PRIPAC_84768 [Pristionchus pacificus]|uniref:Uncharacterized protein n=1 Tax=Pristionchus pacificus TaxID=54126 RepID=A0A454XIZ8_PRIPA|nr:hypothetical protein PRIPAC_84768 [Pristionchus pacificus]|eukprot:PDM66855.1 hypothetical protein PRIPAC_48272 [Pristionchus pacificus]